VSQVPSLTPNFTDVALKIWAYIFFAFGGGISRGSPKSKILALQKSEYSRFWFDMYSVLSTQRAIQIVMYVCKTVSQLQLTSDRLYFSAFLHHHLWQTRDPLLRGRSAFVYHESFVDTIGRISAVMNQISVDNRNFYTPPALLTSLEKWGDGVAQFIAHPIWRICVLLTHLS